mmetsp:Transcript_11112/g.26729  ORF Transcript_11112/g.26729 Transcript_11112/m.26729 type:complete len:242 (+) Transcript_11112:17-742(+)
MRSVLPSSETAVTGHPPWDSRGIECAKYVATGPSAALAGNRLQPCARTSRPGSDGEIDSASTGKVCGAAAVTRTISWSTGAASEYSSSPTTPSGVVILTLPGPGGNRTRRPTLMRACEPSFSTVWTLNSSEGTSPALRYATSLTLPSLPWTWSTPPVWDAAETGATSLAIDPSDDTSTIGNTSDANSGSCAGSIGVTTSSDTGRRRSVPGNGSALTALKRRPVVAMVSSETPAGNRFPGCA